MAAYQAPLSLEANILYENYPTTRVIHTINRGPNKSQEEVRKQELPYASDASDKERLIHVLHSYKQACGNASLHLHDTDRHLKAGEVLRGELGSTWDDTIASANKTDRSFVHNIRSFLTNYMPSNSFLIQQRYFNKATKPYGMDCFAAASRLRLINTLSVYLPGSSGLRLFPNDTALKSAFYKLMLPAWQLAFDVSGNQLHDAAYTLQKLVNFMENHRLHHNASIQRRNRDYHNDDSGHRNNSDSIFQQSPQDNYHQEAYNNANDFYPEGSYDNSYEDDHLYEQENEYPDQHGYSDYDAYDHYY